MPAPQANIAAWKLTLNGQDLTDRIRPYLVSLTLTEKRGGEADQLDLMLDDSDGSLAIPKAGAVLRLQLGWQQGAGVTPGVVDKGTFKVDEAEHSGPPDIITIRARSADLTADYRVRREETHKNTTIGAIVSRVAGRNGLKSSVDPSLASIEVPIKVQHERSDMALVRRLGREHDAVATVKNGTLILSPIGKGATASGKTIAGVTLRRVHGWDHRYSRTKREDYSGVEARWHDQSAAERKTESATVAGGTGPKKRLRRIHHSQADAKAAADAEAKRLARAEATFTYTLALGRADLIPETPVTLKGWKPEIDARKWIVAEVTHTIDSSGGFGTKVNLETAPT